ncbi:MAG: CDP-alcohol phosphatidyltransferase family protein [Gammaproteobacteria bacterium]|nr:CDP-alcohol phosphatidyltransferase family protein [Gammaproteobacteria bacterium]MBQ0839993.1 CDP-alcohol phosphatidyltransferase family protein [Gammaproteobacteria bacterium]
MANSIVSIPNFLSASRLILVPVLLYLAYGGHGEAFLILLAASLLTDGLDGYLARRWNQTSELGARLDSWGDLGTYSAMLLGLFLLWPGIFQQQKWFFLLGFFTYLVPTISCLLKFHELPRYHTWSAKLAAVLMAPAYYSLVLLDSSSFFRGVIFFHIWVALEEVFITFTLNKNYYNVATVFHARELMRRQRFRFRERRVQMQERIGLKERRKVLKNKPPGDGDCR